ncbi:hypothetical protein [Corallococcus exercitus]|uniref:hypothetical protein n=1 Tax=Corallococcus exercitus TaxID=2316736 RepID=UPI0035D41604
MNKHLKLDVQVAEDDPIRKSLLNQRVQHLESDGLSVPEDELLTYSLFYEWDNSPGWRSYADLNRKLPERRTRFGDFLTTDAEESYRLRRKPVSDIIESLGIGAALSVSARLLGVTEADFLKVPDTSLGRTLDFERSYVASDGDHSYRVEAKGTHDGKSVSSALDSIKAKKIFDRNSKQDDATLVGVVFDLSLERKRTSKVIITDPPAEPIPENPILIKLWARLGFYSAALRTISRGSITAGFAQRLPVTRALGDQWRKVDGIPLVNPSGYPLAVSWNKSGIVTLASRERIFGRFFGPASKSTRRQTSSEDVSIFIGLTENTIELLTKQRLEEIIYHKERERVAEASYPAYSPFEARPPFRFQHLRVFSSGVVVGYLIGNV